MSIWQCLLVHVVVHCSVHFVCREKRVQLQRTRVRVLYPLHTSTTPSPITLSHHHTLTITLSHHTPSPSHTSSHPPHPLSHHHTLTITLSHHHILPSHKSSHPPQQSQYAEETIPVLTAAERARTVNARGEYIDHRYPNTNDTMFFNLDPLIADLMVCYTLPLSQSPSGKQEVSSSA